MDATRFGPRAFRRSQGHSVWVPYVLRIDSMADACLEAIMESRPLTLLW